MNIGELLSQLEECNEEARVYCILQSERDASFYHTTVIRTGEKENLVDIIVMETSDIGMTVRDLREELGSYDVMLPVFITESRLRPHRFPYEIIGVKDEKKSVYLKLPQLMAGLFEE